MNGINRRDFIRRAGARAATPAAVLAGGWWAGRSGTNCALADESSRKASGPLRVHPENRRYFADASGEAVYLTGSHTWANLQDQLSPAPLRRFDYPTYLTWMQRHGHNFMPKWEPIRRNMGDSLKLARRLNLTAMSPRNYLASTKYCLADPGIDYVVYLPDNKPVTVDLSSTRARFSVEWYDLHRGKRTAAGFAEGGAVCDFRSPCGGEAVLRLLQLQRNARATGEKSEANCGHPAVQTVPV